MNEEQKALALALLAIPEIREVAEGFRATKLYFCVEWWVGDAKFCAPNLADETGAVEGWLHRVLERLDLARNALADAKAAFEKAVQLRTAANLMGEVK